MLSFQSVDIIYYVIHFSNPFVTALASAKENPALGQLRVSNTLRIFGLAGNLCGRDMSEARKAGEVRVIIDRA